MRQVPPIPDSRLPQSPLPQRRIPALTVMALMLMAADLALTAQGVLWAGPAAEANPVLRWALGHFGIWAIALWALLGSALYVSAAVWPDFPALGPILSLAGVVAHSGGVLAWLNWRPP